MSQNKNIKRMSESLKALKSARKIKYFKNLSLTPSKKKEIQKFLMTLEIKIICGMDEFQTQE